MAARGKRQVTYRNQAKSEVKIGQDTQSPRKDRSTARHSYHQASSNNHLNGPIFDTGNNGHFDNYRSFVSRERSFVRPQSTHAHAHDQGGQLSEGGEFELPRQRSFVLPGQLQQSRDHQQQRRRSAMPANQRGKPAMEIYRPPTLRGSSIFETNGDMIFNGKHANGIYDSQGNFISNNHHNHNMNGRKPGLNIHAKEFISYQPPSLQHSKSSSSVLFQQGKSHGLQHSKSGQNLRTVNEGGSKVGGNTSPSRVHFSENKENNPDIKLGMPSSLSPKPSSLGPFTSPIKRSKSLGSADLRQAMEGGQSTSPDIGPFSQEVQKTITEAMNDPNALSARQLMEVVRHVFLRVIEASRHSEPTARICISIIEKEKGETFLETLLNTCQEYFQERDRLLRNTPPAPYPGYVASHPKWIAYMSFLNEMYTQLKRRHVQLMTRRMRNSETAPGLLLLTLLAQCCHVCLREPSVNSLAEMECLFFVLTAVGKDIEVELPQQMARVMGAARDAFLTSVRVPAVRKTLLQLIEMHAARWNLPAPAVMYYYPGSGAK